jgi:hypothetical protein
LEGPTTAADRIGFVGAFESELDTRPTIDFGDSTVKPAFDRDELEGPSLIIVELDVGGTNQVQGISIPKI